MMEIVFNIFAINKSSRVKIYKEYNTHKYACKSRQCARSSRPGACPLRRARMDPNPLPRKRRDPGWGRGGSGYTSPEGIVVLVWIQPSSPARVQAQRRWPVGPRGPRVGLAEGFPGSPYPACPRAPLLWPLAGYKTGVKAGITQFAAL